MSKSSMIPKLEYASCAKPWEPRKEQKIGVKWLLSYAIAGLFADPGAGKTSIVLAAFKILKRERLVEKMLVVAPLRVCYEVWPVEIEDWTDFKDLRIAILHGSGRERALHSDADIFVINPDGLPWLLAENRLDVISPDMLVVDESSKFKHSNTKRFKLLKPYLPTFSRRVILTGTPNPNGYMDLFGQIYLLDLGKALGRYITHYRMNFFNPTGFGGYTWVLKPGADELIQKAIAPYIYRIDMSNSKEVPPVLDNVIRVDLPAKARKLYDEMEEEMLVELESGETVSAVNTGAAMSKCSQIANGGLYFEPGAEAGDTFHAVHHRNAEVIHDAKTEALVDLVDELQGSSPVLVAFEFTHDLERIRKAFGKDLPYIAGGVSMKRTQEIVAAWNAGKIPLLPAHPAAMGHGLNMQKSNCRHVFWYGITWDLELYDQMIRRVRRPGNKSADIINHLCVARGTVDDVKLRRLTAKAKTQKALLDAMLAYAKERRRNGRKTM